MRIAPVSLALAGLLVALPAAALDRVVDDALVPCTGGPLPVHATIGDAVAAASDGETILVCPGTYTEPVTIDKHLTLRAQGIVKLQSPGTAGSGFLVTAVGPGTRIEGFDVSGYTLAPDCGIRVVFAAGADIVDNRVHGNRVGICVQFTGNTRVLGNVAEANLLDGILVGAGTAEVSGNITRDNGGWGITAVACLGGGVAIDRNLVTRNDGGGIRADDCNGAGISHNTVRGEHHPGVHGIHVSGGEAVAVTRNLVQFWDVGVLLEFQDGCAVGFNSVSFNDVGIDVHAPPGCRIFRNNVSRSRTIDCRWDGVPHPIFSGNACGTEVPVGAWD